MGNRWCEIDVDEIFRDANELGLHHIELLQRQRVLWVINLSNYL